MILWGSTIDPEKAEKYEVPLVEDVLPPQDAPDRHTVAPPTATSTTKQHPKPTEHLPGDHGHAPGENTKPAFSSATRVDETKPTSTTTPTPSPPAMSSTPDVGWFPDMSNLVNSQKWFFVAFGAVSIFGISAGIFFWRRRAARANENYTSLNNEGDVNMATLGTSMTGPRTTRELYDAFGELSDDDDDDETTALRQPLARSVGFHSGFLDDDDPSTAAGLTPKYRDEPVQEEGSSHRAAHSQLDRPGGSEEHLASPSGSGSGDGSWDHASRE